MEYRTIDDEPVDSILRLADELLQALFYHLAPHDALHLGSTCRRLKLLEEHPILWRYYCETEYDYWHVSDDTEAAIIQRLPSAPWKKHFHRRLVRDKHNKERFESALSSQRQRYLKIQQVASVGLESRQMLIDNIRCPDSTEDALARRYYANAAIGLINRTAALKIWSNLDLDPQITMEESIAAFDMFIIGPRWGNVSDITDALDNAAVEIQTHCPGLLELDHETRALMIADWLREHGLIGLDMSTPRFHAMKHNFFSFTLGDRSRCSLPLQSTVIFCAVARRLGLTAHCVPFPGHICALVLPPGPTANSSTPPDDPTSHRLYFSPWMSSEHPLPGTVTYSFLAAQLSRHNIPPSQHAELLSPASKADMVRRTCANILRSYEEWHNIPPGRDDLIGNLDALYAHCWALTLLGTGNDQPIEGTEANAAQLIGILQEHFPQDTQLVRRFLASFFARSRRAGFLLTVVRGIEVADMEPKVVRRRFPGSGDGGAGPVIGVRFKVGQMFQHKRYGYLGVIRGWDGQCEAHEDWVESQNIDELPGGRTQAFYNILCEDTSSRYVAEENIEPVYTEPSPRLMALAGRYFKRWDADRRMFISNIKEEYPDD